MSTLRRVHQGQREQEQTASQHPLHLESPEVLTYNMSLPNAWHNYGLAGSKLTIADCSMQRHHCIEKAGQPKALLPDAAG